MTTRGGRVARWIGAGVIPLAAWVVPIRHAASADVLIVGAFSTAPEGPGAPPGWKPLTFKKVSKPTDYAVVRDGDAVVVRAESHGAASGLTREVAIDLKVYPRVAWRWKVANVITKSDVTKKTGDDYAARLYLTFAYDPDKVSLGKKAKYKASRLLFGDIPIAAITYIWERATPVGTIVPNAYTDFVRMVVIESGGTNIGRWMDEERNLYDDYRSAFGEEPPLVNGVAIMTDTDDTGESATAYYGDIFFMRK
jgi:hypothetical protein